MARKKKGSEEGGGGDPFMMMFVTLSLILLAFFILLNSLSVVDAEKRKKAIGSLLGTFGMMPGANSVSRTTDGENGELSVLRKEIMNLYMGAQKEVATLISMAVASQDDIYLHVDTIKGEIQIALSESLLFGSGTAAITPAVFPLLSKIASICEESAGRTIVTGHTDNRRIRGGGSNWQLSLERGAAVARHLEAVGTTPRGKIRASGASYYKARGDNRTEQGRASNRRVEILIKAIKDGGR